MKKSVRKYHFKLLNDFANSHTLAEHIKVEIHEHHKSFKPKDSYSGARYEDANLLASIIHGAESFIYYLERNGIEIPSKRVRTYSKMSKRCGRGVNS